MVTPFDLEAGVKGQTSQAMTFYKLFSHSKPPEVMIRET